MRHETKSTGPARWLIYPQKRRYLGFAPSMVIASLLITLTLGCAHGPRAESSGLTVAQPTTRSTSVAVEPVRYGPWDAFRITDGRSEAVIVPTIGRVMRYGLVGGPNVLWNAELPSKVSTGFENVGGDKLYVGPHSAWQATGGRMWPPPDGFDGVAHAVRRPTPTSIETRSPTWPGFGVQIVRTFSFDRDGRFRIQNRLEKVAVGGPELVSAWTVTQVPHVELVTLSGNQTLPSQPPFDWISRPDPKATVVVGERTPDGRVPVRIKPGFSSSYKLNVPADQPALQADYADGASFGQQVEGSHPGAKLEFYNHSDRLQPYCELETLSPPASLTTPIEWTVTWTIKKSGWSSTQRK